MLSTITQSTPGYSDYTGAGQEDKLGNTRQCTNKTRTNKANQVRKGKTTLGTPVSQSRKTTRSQAKELHWVPQEFLKQNGVQNWCVQQARTMRK